MPSATAVNQVDTLFEAEERVRPAEAPVSEQARYRPRFRVVTRRPLAPAVPVRVNPTHRATLIAAVPALCLLVYVLFWTLAMRGGYYRAQLQAEIHEIKIERAELEAEKRRLQSPGYILHRASGELGMQPAGEREFAELPVPEKFAAGRAADKERLTR